MKNVKSVVLIVCSILLSTAMFGQKIRLIDGDLKDLKNIKKIKTEFVYDGMGVGKFDNEQDYIDKKVKEYNEKEKGKGDTWAKAWKADRKNRFEPQFNELFSKHAEINAGNFSDAKYTMIVKTIFTEPGFNIYITRKNAEINLEVQIVETDDHSKVIANLSINRAQGRTFGGYDFDSGERIQEAYAKAGKEFGSFIDKKRKK